MYYTAAQINGYYKKLLNKTKLNDEEIAVLELHNMRKLAEELKLIATVTSSEIHHFKNKQISRGYLHIIEKEFFSLVEELKKVVMEDPKSIYIREKRLQEIEFSNTIFTRAVQAVPASHAKKTKHENLRLAINIFTLTSRDSILEKAKIINKPDPMSKIPKEFIPCQNNSESKWIPTKKTEPKKVVTIKFSLEDNFFSNKKRKFDETAINNNNASNVNKKSKPEILPLTDEDYNTTESDEYDHHSDYDSDYKPSKHFTYSNKL